MVSKVKFLASPGFALFIFFIASHVYSQSSLFLVNGTEFTGLPYNYEFQQHGNILNRGWAFNDGSSGGGIGFAFNLGLHYRLSDKIGIETGIQYNEMDLIVHDKKFMNDTGFKGDDGADNFSGTAVHESNFDATNWYRSHYVSAYYFLPSRSRTNLFFSGGLAINYLTGPINMTGTYQSDTRNEVLQLTTHYKPIYLNSFIETGLCFNSNRERSGHKPIYFLSFKYYFAKDLLTGDYQDTQNGRVVYSDHVDSSGSYLAFNLKVGGLIRGGLPPIAATHYSPRSHNPAYSHHHLKATHSRRNKPRKVGKGKRLNTPHPSIIDHSNTRGF